MAESPAPETLTPFRPLPFTMTPLRPGDRAPELTLPLLSGGEWSLARHRGAGVALLFSDPACPPCRDLLHRLGNEPVPGLVIVSRGDAAEIRRLLGEARSSAPVLVQRQREAARRFRMLETPALYVIDGQGAIAAGPVVGTDAILALLAHRTAGGV